METPTNIRMQRMRARKKARDDADRFGATLLEHDLFARNERGELFGWDHGAGWRRV